jgi:hypothetical protein
VGPERGQRSLLKPLPGLRPPHVDARNGAASGGGAALPATEELKGAPKQSQLLAAYRQQSTEQQERQETAPQGPSHLAMDVLVPAMSRSVVTMPGDRLWMPTFFSPSLRSSDCSDLLSCSRPRLVAP